MPERKRKIIDAAIESGFSDIGFAGAGPIEREYAIFRKWLDGANHATMKWLERNTDKRRDIRNILPGAKTVVVTAFNYYTEHFHSGASRKGKISRYAWNFDYHNIIRPMLDELSGAIESIYPGSKTWRYVDTGPVLERSWAQRAGIGWVGKNGVVISKKFGSWFFIGIVITTAEIEPDSPHKNFCGKCRKCIDACPTGAIYEPRLVDSRKCISYQTIEVKQDMQIPDEITKNLNGWLFGCDICQEVCPWNRKNQKAILDSRFAPRDDETEIELERILIMQQQEFSERFRKSPLKRTKLGGLKRNAASLISFGKFK